MSKEAAVQWIKKLHEDEGLRKQVEAAGNFEARQSLAGEHGFEFVKEEIEAVVSAHKAELSDEDLDAVSGGGLAEQWDDLSDDKKQDAGEALATGVGVVAASIAAL